MEIVGYIGYAVLVILAIIWTIGVRTQLGAGTHTILGALYFVVSAAIIPVIDIDMLHSLWVIPVGFLFAGIIAPVLVRIPGVSFVFRFIAGLYSGVIRIGIPRQRIEEAQAVSMRAAVDDYFNKQE
jgi:hypothetical protein